MLLWLLYITCLPASTRNSSFWTILAVLTSKVWELSYFNLDINNIRLIAYRQAKFRSSKSKHGGDYPSISIFGKVRIICGGIMSLFLVDDDWVVFFYWIVCVFFFLFFSLRCCYDPLQVFSFVLLFCICSCRVIACFWWVWLVFHILLFHERNLPFLLCCVLYFFQIFHLHLLWRYYL